MQNIFSYHRPSAPLDKGASVGKISTPAPVKPRLFVLPHEWEFALKEGGLNGICILAGAGDFGGLPASECDFVNEVFAPGGAAGFPSHEDVSGDETADGRS